MAKSNRKARRRPMDPQAAAERRAAQKRAEDNRMREEGIDPVAARFEDERLGEDRIETFARHGVVYETDLRGRLKHAHRADVFEELFKRGTLTRDEHAAIRALQDLMIIRAGMGGRDERMSYDRDKADTPLRDPSLVNDTMVDAGRKVDLTLRLVGPPSGELLNALLNPVAERKTVTKRVWRCYVRKERGGPACEAINPENDRLCEGCGVERPERFALEALVLPEDWRSVVARVTRITNPQSQSAPLKVAALALVSVADDVERLFQRQRKERAEGQGMAA